MPILRLTPPEAYPSLGFEVFDWIETHLCHGPGDVEGDPLMLDTELLAFVVDAYRVYPANHPKAGQRVVFDATFSRPKGRAKSELAGMLACAEAIGPVRFDHWAEPGEVSSCGFVYQAGDPVGRPVASPFIRCLATEEGQAGNTYKNVEVMLEHLSEHHGERFPSIDVGSTRTLIGGSGEIRPATSGAASKDGARPTFAVADEVHLYVLPEHKQMLATERRNLRKRKAAEPWFMSTTTMFRPGQESVAEGRFEWAMRHERALSRDLSVLFDHRQGWVPKEWDDDEAMTASLAEAYGEFAHVMNLDGILSEIRDPSTDVGDAIRYFINARAEYADAAFDISLWDDLADPDVEVEPGGMIVAGFDGARFDDSTALTARCLETGHRWLFGLWEKPADAGRDWEVDESEVSRAFERMFDEHDVWRVYCDPPYWETPIGAWQAEFGEDRVVQWHTNRSKQMAYACKRFQTALRAGEGSHDGDPDLRRHLANAYREDLPRLKDDRGRPMWRIRKERAGSPRKIDAAMALILADEAYGDAVVAGMLNRRSYSPVKLR